MKPIVLFFAILFFCAMDVKAQSSMDSVKTTISNMFSAMKNSDSQALLACFTDSAILQTIARDRNGETVIKSERLHNFATVIGSMPREMADERISFDLVKVDGPMASVWTPYKFYLSGQFSHCGVNSFQLVRVKGNWKIQYLIDTRRKQGCE